MSTLYRMTLALLLMIMVFSGQVVLAGTYYVSPTGNDSNPGIANQAFRTIARGISSLNAGDTLYIRGGTYAESIDSNKQTIPTGTSWADAPVISAYPNETVTLQAYSAINLPHDYIQYVRFENLILDGGYQNIGVGGRAHHIKFVNLEVKNGVHQCVQIGHLAHDIWFTGGRVHDCGLTQPVELAGYPFYIGGNDHLIENIEVYNSNRYCIHIYDSNPPYPNRVIVRNSTFHHCGLTVPSSSAILLSTGDSNMAYNNIIYSTKSHGILTCCKDTNSKIYNNTIYGGAETGIYVQSGSTNADVRNNIAYANRTTQILDLGVGTILSKNLTSDPRFINPAAFDFNLQPSSPAIDTGVTLSQVTTDFKKNFRPQGGGYDIGAYEVGKGSDTVPPNAPQNVIVR